MGTPQSSHERHGLHVILEARLSDGGGQMSQGVPAGGEVGGGQGGQQLDAAARRVLLVAHDVDDVEGAVPFGSASGHVGAGVEQKLHEGQVGGHCGIHERSPTLAALEIERRLSRNQNLRDATKLGVNRDEVQQGPRDERVVPLLVGQGDLHFVVDAGVCVFEPESQIVFDAC